MRTSSYSSSACRTGPPTYGICWSASPKSLAGSLPGRWSLSSRSSSRGAILLSYSGGHGVQSRFDPARSYGFAAALGAQYWGGPVRRRIRSPIQLLKPHGSLNWRVSSKGGVTTLALRADPYVGSAAERIIPPIAGKSIAAEPFATVWAAARDALARCRALVVVGYSAPDVDALSQALIRLHLATEVPRRLSALVVANPNQDVRNRWRSLCATAIRPARTRIFEYRTLDELAGAIS